MPDLINAARQIIVPSKNAADLSGSFLFFFVIHKIVRKMSSFVLRVSQKLTVVAGFTQERIFGLSCIFKSIIFKIKHNFEIIEEVKTHNSVCSA